MAFASIAADAREFSQKLGLSADFAMIDRAWSLEIGALEADARIVAIDRGSLVVEADSHAAMQELSLRRRELVRKLNRHLAGAPLVHITIRLAQTHGR